MSEYVLLEEADDEPVTPVRIFPFSGDGKWYWQDNLCQEPMGPFDSYREAWKDYKACRK